MNKPTLEQFREAFDSAFGKNTGLSQGEIDEIFEQGGISGFIKLKLEREIGDAFAHSWKVLEDLTKLSFAIYGNLDDLPLKRTVILPDDSGMYKFIITGVSPFADRSELEKYDREPNEIIFLSTQDSYHKDMAKTIGYEDSYSGTLSVINDSSMFGGGRIKIDHENMTLEVSLSSGSFGSVSNELVERMLEECIEQGYSLNTNLDSQEYFFGRINE